MLEPDEAGWLEGHLGACPDCRSIATAYAAQQLELRALVGRNPSPPRDLWARTAAAIEAESRFRDPRVRTTGRGGRRLLAPSALLATALVVAVAVGTLTSSQHPGVDGGAGSPALLAVAPPTGDSPGPVPTRIPVTQQIAYVSKDSSGAYSIKTKNVDTVCPSPSTSPCDDLNPTVDRTIAVDQAASTVFGSPNQARLIVVNDPTSPNGGGISVVPLGSESPATATATPSATASPAPSIAASASPVGGSAVPSGSTSSPVATPTPQATPSATPPPPPPSPSPSPSPSVAASPTASVAITPSPDGVIEIAHDVALVGQSAAYSASGDWFAFTARPLDNSTGPDIYAWRVGDAVAKRVTSDHRSVFGSWIGETIIASTVVSASPDGAPPAVDMTPSSFSLDPVTSAVVALPQLGQAWRPAVDPSGRRAVYWSGSVRATASHGYAPGAGRLVLGDWPTSSDPTSSASPASAAGDQGGARHETTISAGRLDDWDARWDVSGTRLAIWIADPGDPATGRLSLYAVDAFDGKIDLKSPLLDSARAVAGYSISSGQLVWAEPPAPGATTGRVQLLAWTSNGVGTVSTVTGPVIVVR